MRIAIFLFSLFCFLLCTEHVTHAKPKPKEKNSCTVFRGKYTAADLIDIRYGIKGGENIATIKSNKGTSQDIITGWMGGVAVQVAWPKGFALQPEVLYSQKGCIIQGTNMKYHINYLEVPVNFMYRLNMAQIKPFVLVAPYGAYALKISEEADLVANSNKNIINKWDYGVGVGAGFDAWMVQLAFKYSWGFAKLVDNSDHIRNKTFTISAAVFF